MTLRSCSSSLGHPHFLVNRLWEPLQSFPLQIAGSCQCAGGTQPLDVPLQRYDAFRRLDRAWLCLICSIFPRIFEVSWYLLHVFCHWFAPVDCHKTNKKHVLADHLASKNQVDNACSLLVADLARIQKSLNLLRFFEPVGFMSRNDCPKVTTLFPPLSST